MATKEEEMSAAGADPATADPEGSPDGGASSVSTSPIKESLRKPVSGLDSEEDVEKAGSEEFKELKTVVENMKERHETDLGILKNAIVDLKQMIKGETQERETREAQYKEEAKNNLKKEMEQFEEKMKKEMEQLEEKMKNDDKKRE